MATKRKKKGDKHYVNNKEFTKSIIEDKNNEQLTVCIMKTLETEKIVFNLPF